MASAHIEITATASRYSAEMRALVDRLRDIVELSQKLKEIGDQIVLGDDWATLATYLAVSAADAETVYNLLGSVNQELGGTFIAQMLSRLG